MIRVLLLSAPSFFRPFASSPSVFAGPSAPSAPLVSSSSGVLPSASSFHPSAPSFDPAASFGFGASEDLLEDSPPDAVPRVIDPGFAVVLEAVCSEFCRMMCFIVNLFPQAAGSPSIPSPPRAVFEDFFCSSTPSSSPIFLNWFERVRSALSEADSHLANFVASGRGDFLLLSSRSPVCCSRGFCFGGVRLRLALLFFLCLSVALNP